MPTKHLVKSYAAPAFYHVYNRAAGERKLFRDAQDYAYFSELLEKHTDRTQSAGERTFAIDIVAHCLLGTHFHLLVFQEVDPAALTGLMRTISTKYAMYYNRKYRSRGHVFQSSYRASRITDDSYLAHVSRYIHLNPRYFETWRWSSYRDFIGETRRAWIHPGLVSGDTATYRRFVEEYASTDRRLQRREVRRFLAM